MDIFKTLEQQMADALNDLRILAGDEVGHSDASWQDVAGTAALNLRSLSSMLDSLRQGDSHFRGAPWTGGVSFPSPADLIQQD